MSPQPGEIWLAALRFAVRPLPTVRLQRRLLAELMERLKVALAFASDLYRASDGRSAAFT
jgi:hypothetical protein